MDSTKPPGSDPQGLRQYNAAAKRAAVISVDGGSDVPRVPRWTGCPCGCTTKLPYLDDPACARHLPAPRPRDPGGYDVVTLGLAPHDREQCEQCRAVAS